MTRRELAEEFALTDAAAAEFCARLAIPTSSPDDVLSDVDVERFRLAARADLALGPTPGPAPGPSAGGTEPGPFRTPGAGEPDPGPSDDVAAGWAAPDPTGAWAPVTNGHGEHHPGGGPGAGPAPPGQASWASSADLARLDEARSRANSYMTSGYALLALGLLITIGTLALAPGGFFIISFGTVFVGFRRLRAGRMMRAQIRAAEQRLGPDAP